MRVDASVAQFAARAVGTAVTWSVAAVEGIAFWLAVALPVLYGPGLLWYARGDVSGYTLAALAGAHAVALLVGHRYNRSPGAEADIDGARAEV